jgi:hypothetical protein
MNLLPYGENVDVLRRHAEDESIDLVYLAAPFNSNASDNILFAERDGKGSRASQGTDSIRFRSLAEPHSLPLPQILSRPFDYVPYNAALT